jgi:microcystin-dependent protein
MRISIRAIRAGAVGAAMLAGAAPSALAQEAYIGQIVDFGFRFCPRGTLPTDGRAMPIAQNTALFSLLGTTYGGDGRTTFNLPTIKKDVKSDTEAPVTTCIVVEGVYPSRN